MTTVKPPKTELQELAQAGHHELPRYETFREGPDHAPLWSATVHLWSSMYFDSEMMHSTARAAESDAAAVALRELATMPFTPDEIAAAGEFMERADEHLTSLHTDLSSGVKKALDALDSGRVDVAKTELLALLERLG